MTESRLQIGHVFIENMIGGCETCAKSVIKGSAYVDHHALFFSEEGDGSRMLKPNVSSVQISPTHRWNFGGFATKVTQWAKDKHLSGVILWHGLNALPPLLHGLESAGVHTLVHGGNPALGLPLKQEVKFAALDHLFPVKKYPICFCCSQYVAQSFQSSDYLKKFPTAVIYNGVVISDKYHKTEYSIQGKATIGMIARLDHGKDHQTLIDSFAHVLKKHPNTFLELLGDGPLRKELEAQVEELGISNHVKFWGSQFDITPIMSKWDIFAYSTTKHEGFGISLAEAMFMGLPCVVTDVGPIPEVVGSASRALIQKPHDDLDLADGICKLLVNEGLRQKLGTSARDYAKKTYDPNIHSQKVISLLTQPLQGSSQNCLSPPLSSESF